MEKKLPSFPDNISNSSCTRKSCTSITRLDGKSTMIFFSILFHYGDNRYGFIYKQITWKRIYKRPSDGNMFGFFRLRVVLRSYRFERQRTTLLNALQSNAK